MSLDLDVYPIYEVGVAYKDVQPRYRVVGQIFEDVFPSYAVYAPLDTDVYPRIKITGSNARLNKDIYPRYSMQHHFIDVFPRYKMIERVNLDAVARYAVFPSIGSNPAQPGESPWVAATEQDIDPGFSVNFTVLRNSGGPIDLGDRPFHFQVDMSDSAASTWTLSFIDPFGQANPMKVGGEFENIMDERPYTPLGSGPTTTGELTKFLVVNAMVGGTEWDFTGVGTNFNHSRDWQNNYFDYVWKGTDCSLLLNVDGQTMADVRSNARGVIKASQVLIGQFDKYKVTKYDIARFKGRDDYTVPVMHRQNGNPQDWTTMILGAMLYDWHWVNGKTFTAYLNDPTNQSQEFTHNFGAMNVYSESYEGALFNVINQVIAIRAAEGGGASEATSNPPIQMFEFGDNYSQSFNPPLDSVSIQEAPNPIGFVSNVRFYRGEELIAVRYVTSGSANYGIQFTSSGIITGATSARWTYGVQAGGFIGAGSPGKVQFNGVPHVDPEVWGGNQFGESGGPDDPAPSFRAEAKSTESIGKYGVRPIEISANPLIPDQPTLQKFADRYLSRVVRQPRKASYKIPLNPHIRPGTVIKEIDMRLGTTKFRTVNSCSHSFSNDLSERYTTYTGTDYSQLTR